MTSKAARIAANVQEALRPIVRPSVFDFWARELRTTASHGRTVARIVGKRPESRRAVTLELAPNAQFAGFIPGQHVNVTVDVGGRRLTRSYSLTGTPRPDGRLSLSVQRVEGGEVSAHLFANAQVGDFVELDAAFGEMTLPAALDAPMLFLAAGSGITPLMSLTRALAERGMPVPVTLVYWARHRADLCFAEELKALAQREPNFTFRVALTGDAVTATDELRGRPSHALLAEAAPDLAARAVYACGPAGFVSEVESLCAKTARTFVSEAFTPPTFTPSTDGAKVTVQLAKSGKTVTVASGQPLLAALEAAGVKPASGCRMGICNTCACKKLDGTTRDLKSGDESRGANPNLRICISSAQTDLSLDL